MADSPVSLALQEIKERMSALNFATDAVTLRRDRHELDPEIASRKLRRLSNRRTDLRDARKTIIDTNAVTQPPTPAEVDALRKSVARLYDFNTAADAIDALVDEALRIAAS